MADSGLQQSSGPEALDENLSRLGKKPGVKATILLDRATGNILRTSGQVSSIRTSGSMSSTAPGGNQPGGSFSGTADANGDVPSETQGVEELSALVWNFVKTAGTLVDEVDREDELKLLRLRTKKQELVIVPDARFLHIVIHDTPPTV